MQSVVADGSTCANFNIIYHNGMNCTQTVTAQVALLFCLCWSSVSSKADSTVRIHELNKKKRNLCALKMDETGCCETWCVCGKSTVLRPRRHMGLCVSTVHSYRTTVSRKYHGSRVSGWVLNREPPGYGTTLITYTGECLLCLRPGRHICICRYTRLGYG
jgi:hypothetical protein